MADHTLYSRPWPGSSTQPWQITYHCTCGADLDAFDEQGLGSVDTDAALAEHIRDMEAA